MGFSIAENDRTDKALLISCRMAHGSQAVRQPDSPDSQAGSRQAGRQVADSQAVQAGQTASGRQPARQPGSIDALPEILTVVLLVLSGRAFSSTGDLKRFNVVFVWLIRRIDLTR